MKRNPLLLMLCILFIFSCRKGDIGGQSENEIKTKVNAWLKAQERPGNPDITQKVQELGKHLNFDKTYYEELNASEKFLIIPVNTEFTTINNKDKKPANNLVLRINKTEDIASGLIYQYMSNNGTEANRLPENALHQMHNSQPVADGIYTTLTIYDRYLYEQEYKSGNLYRYTQMGTEEQFETPRRANARTNGCIDWYVVTTWYGENGQVIDVDYDYIGTTCNNCGYTDPNGQGQVCDEITGGGGNGGGGYGEPANKQVEWVVKADAFAKWHIKSYETLHAIKPGLPNTSYFTSIVHQNDAIFNEYGPSSQLYGTWQRLAVTTGLTTGGGSGSCTISGKVSNGYGDQSVSNAKPWLAANEFPQ
ncbi:MAG: hypothetical protein JNM68_13985 [Dinghuibacter sp.]|nr:hypothetical protein [Dinghuibacter sp.]